jgi:hypothetical protein
MNYAGHEKQGYEADKKQRYEAARYQQMRGQSGQSSHVGIPFFIGKLCIYIACLTMHVGVVKTFTLTGHQTSPA